MKINIFKRSVITKISLFFAIAITIASCNKALPDATPIIYPPVNNSTVSIGTLINTDTTYSFFKAAASKVNMLSQFSDTTKVFTVFLPNNAAFRASGFPSVAAVNSLPPTVLGAIVAYSVIPGMQLLSDSVPTAFPNIQLPTEVYTGSTLPGTMLQFNLTTFPSRRSNGFWDNNIPVLVPDMRMQNGVIHLVAGIVAPPSQVLRDALYGNPNLTYFKAAIARADSGQTGLNRFDSLLNYPVTNMTVLAPNDAAFQALIFGLVFKGYLAQIPSPNAMDTATAALYANGAVAAGPAFLSTPNVTSELIRGVMAYHFLATNTGAGFQPNIRAFSVNFSTTPAFYTTLVNNVLATHPGIMAQATFAGALPFVASLQFTGVGPLGPGVMPFTGGAANAAVSSTTQLVIDNHAVNGVYFVIDKVLLPQ